jgi:predicted transcriptional regulator with HTH domain
MSENEKLGKAVKYYKLTEKAKNIKTILLF